MNDIRAKFEEIWPVPDGIYWDKVEGEYMPIDLTRAENDKFELACEWDARLDTFTRCQEKTDVYVSLVQDILAVIDRLAEDAYGCIPQPTQDIVDLANLLIGAKE